MKPSFFQAGRYIINLDNIAYVENFSDTQIDVVFAAVGPERPLSVTLRDDDAKTFVTVLIGQQKKLA